MIEPLGYVLISAIDQLRWTTERLLLSLASNKLHNFPLMRCDAVWCDVVTFILPTCHPFGRPSYFPTCTMNLAADDFLLFDSPYLIPEPMLANQFNCRSFASHTHGALKANRLDIPKSLAASVLSTVAGARASGCICILEVAQSNASQLFLVRCQLAAKACQKRSKWRRWRFFFDPLTEIHMHCLSATSICKYILHFLLANVINLSGKYNYSVSSINLSHRNGLHLYKFFAQLLSRLTSFRKEKWKHMYVVPTIIHPVY